MHDKSIVLINTYTVLINYIHYNNSNKVLMSTAKMSATYKPTTSVSTPNEVPKYTSLYDNKSYIFQGKAHMV